MADHMAIVTAILEGDREQFRTLVTEFKRLVAHIVFRMIPEIDDREDMCQEVFVKVYQGLASFRSDCKLSTWIAQIAFNTCLSALQKKRLPLVDELAENLDDLGSDSMQLTSNRPDQRYEADDSSAILVREIDRLPAIQGTVIALFHFEEMSLTEIAEIMKVPEGTIKSHLFRGRRLLKERLIKEYQWER